MTKVPVTMRALIQRINRKLHDDDEVLRKLRGDRGLVDLGRYYVVDWRLNSIVRTDVDPEDLAREIGVLKPYEAVVEEGR